MVASEVAAIVSGDLPVHIYASRIVCPVLVLFEVVCGCVSPLQFLAVLGMCVPELGCVASKWYVACWDSAAA